MATIGEPLTAPESGWKRYDDTETLLNYTGLWNVGGAVVGAYKGSVKATATIDEKVSFKFIGTKIRIIGATNKGSANIEIDIDGTKETISCGGSLVWQALLYERLNLTDTEHTVTITNKEKNYFWFDAVDLSSTGRLTHPDEVIDIKDLVVGKRIRCNYSTLPGLSGAFNGLGEESADFIPISSTANPNGDFYFIMAEDFNKKKILIADRNIQHSISWDVLNNVGMVSGVKMPTKPFSNSLSGYENDEVVLTDNGYASGAYGNYYAWRAFDGKAGVGDKWARAVSANNPAELTIRFKKGNQIINAFTLTPPPISSAPSAEHPKHFKLQASNDGNSWVGIFEHSNGIGASRTRFSFNNKLAYSYYRFAVLSANGSSQMQIGELEFESDSGKSSVETTIRLLTGGITGGDTENEWDKYIVNSTLNGKITAGDNTVWNWNNNIWTWTSTTRLINQYPSSHRVLRGQSSVSGLGSNTTNLAVNGSFLYGFRPVLEIKTIFQLRSLILSNGEYKKFNPGQPFSPATSQDATPAMTSNTTPSGLAFASSIYSNTYDAWYAFNKKDDGEGWVMRPSSIAYLGYGFTTSKTIIKYILRSGTMLNELPKSWTLSGSNDSTNGADGTWAILDNRKEQTWTTNHTDKEYTVQSPGPYKFYRLDILENNGNTAYIGVNEFKLYELVTPSSPAVPSSWETVSTTLPDSDTFIDKGMNDLAVFDRKLTTFEIPMNDNTASGEVLGKGRMFKERIDLNNYIDIKKINVK
ncbi:discoidin domain-containing protein [Paenibacillus glucanolyticus]